jgi:hypothetical protein
MPVASSLRSFSQPSIDEDPYLLERHKMQNKQLEAKYEELVD